MTLTKAQIAEKLQNKFKLTKLTSKKLVDIVFEEIRVTLENGIPVKLSGLGNFELRCKKERPGRNPRTGESKLVKARRVVTFKAGQKLRAKILKHRQKIEKS